ncbi:MAG: hypothetical protein ABT940_06015, partial [Alphaproteobacteria bacterium]
MPAPSVPLRRLIGPTAAVAAPVVGAFLVLLLLGELRPLAALAGMVVVIGLTMALLRPHFSDTLAVAIFARELTRHGDVALPEFSSGVAGELSTAVVQLRRLWVETNAELSSLVTSSNLILDSLPDPLLLLGEGRRVVRDNLAARTL